MSEEYKDKISNTIKDVCNERKKSNNYLNLLQEIYNHVSGHPNQELDSRSSNIKNIIEYNFSILKEEI